METTVGEVTSALDSFAPPGLAESWDRVGLQVGDPAARVDRVVVALDPSPAALVSARSYGAQLLVTHHPLLLQPLERLDLSTPRGRLVADFLRSEVNLYAAHTNLDRVEGGVNDGLVRRLRLRDASPLTRGERQVKGVVTVPLGYQERVRRALAEAGAGRVGAYAGCAFQVRGVGTFTPLPAAEPFLGDAGGEVRADEVRLEVLIPWSLLGAVRRAVARVHPYEEPAFDVYPLEGAATPAGLGRIGRLAEPVPAGEWSRWAVRELEAPGARLVGHPGTRIDTVAVCGGSGAELWGAAQAAGADLLVTGDVKYHTARDALDEGFCLLDVGHGPSERAAVEVLRDAIEEWGRRKRVDLTVYEHREPDPFLWL